MNNSSRFLAPRLLAGFGATALVAAVGLFASSRPAHTAGGPIPVTVSNAPLYAVTQDADNPGRQPVEFTATITDSSPDVFLYTVPAGKRLVIDYVSTTPVQSGDRNSYNFFLEAVFNGKTQYANFNELPDTAPFAALSQKVQLFSDPGTNVQVVVSSNGKQPTGVILTVSGHLVNL